MQAAYLDIVLIKQSVKSGEQMERQHNRAKKIKLDQALRKQKEK